MGQQGVQEGGEKERFDPMYRLPHRVRDMVGARGGGVRGFGEGPGYLFGGEGGVVLMACDVEGWGRWGFGGEKVVKKCCRYLGRIRGAWQVWESLWW